MNLHTCLLRAYSVGGISLAFSAALQANFQSFPIATNVGEKRSARTDGEFATWGDLAYLGGPLGTNNVWARNLTTSLLLPVSTGPGQQDEPAIDRNIAVWNESGASGNNGVDLKGGNLRTGTRFTVTNAQGNQSAPSISGDLVVWHDSRTSTNSIWGRRLSDPQGSDFQISPINSRTESFPDVDASTVVWMSTPGTGGPHDIFGRDLATGNVFPICTNAADQLFPRVSGNVVVWQDWRSGRPRVYGKRLDTGLEFPISDTGTSEQIEPAIDGDLVVWMDGRNGTWDIYGRFLSGGSEFAITDTSPMNETWPDVSGRTVVWEQSITGSLNDIYGTLVPEPGGFTLGLMSALLVSRRRKRD